MFNRFFKNRSRPKSGQRVFQKMFETKFRSTGFSKIIQDQILFNGFFKYSSRLNEADVFLEFFLHMNSYTFDHTPVQKKKQSAMLLCQTRTKIGKNVTEPQHTNV